MRKYFACLFLAALVFAALPAEAYRSEVFTVIMNESGFFPRELSIKRGQTAVFENQGKEARWPELVAAQKGLSDSGPLKNMLQGEKWGFKTEKTGVWEIRDRLNKEAAGKITVKEFDGETPSRPPENYKKDRTAFLAEVDRALAGFFHKIFLWISFSKDDGTDVNSRAIAEDDAALMNYIKKFGGGQTLARLETLTTEAGCHDRAHRAGKIAYEVFKDAAFQWHAFSFTSECNTGFFHGLLESYLKSGGEHYFLQSPIKEYGKENILKTVKGICDKSSFDLKCAHVLGHSIMAWSKYELFDALDVCDDLSQDKFIREECWRGVFMENADGGLNQKTEHMTEYLKDDDVIYPCDIVEEKYWGACYQFIPGQLDRVLRNDPENAAKACLKMPFPHNRGCFSNLGFYAMRDHINELEKAVAYCSYAPEGDMRIMCTVGAAREAAFNPDKREQVFKFCELTENEPEKDACYNAAFSNARYSLSHDKEYEKFCSYATDKALKERCLNQR